MQDAAAPYLFLCLLLFSFRRPYAIGIAPVRPFVRPSVRPCTSMLSSSFAPLTLITPSPNTPKQIVLFDGMELLWLFSECLALVRPASAKGLASHLVGAATAYSRNPRYGQLAYVPFALCLDSSRQPPHGMSPFIHSFIHSSNQPRGALARAVPRHEKALRDP